MSDYRIYVRTSVAPFDGATTETATYVQSRFRWSTTATTAVGLWTPASIGRTNTASLVRVFARDGLAAPGDTVTVQTATGATRYTDVYRAAGTDVLFLEPDDRISITSAASLQCEIQVNDLSDDQLSRYSDALTIAAAQAPDCCETQAITMTATGTVPSFDGDLTVFLTPAVAATISLPALASVAEGATIRFIRVSGAGVPTIQTAAAGDEVNGITTASYTPWTMRSLQDSVVYRRVSLGWQRDQGTPAASVVASAVDPITVPAAPEGTCYVLDSIAATPASINLPALSVVRAGYRVLVANVSRFAHTIVPALGDSIDNSAVAYDIPGQTTVLLEAADSTWISLPEDASPPVTVSAGAVTAITGFRGGLEIVQASNASGTVNLPAISAVPIYSRVLVQNTGTGSITLDADGAELINGNATRTVWQGQAALLTSNGVSWTAVGGVFQPAVVTDANPIVLTAWQDNPQAVESTGAGGQTITLPIAASVPIGAEVICFNSSANAHVIAADAADTINGAASVALAAGTTVRAVRVAATAWFAILGA